VTTDITAQQQNTWAVETKELTKSFGRVVALRNVTLQVPYGISMAIIGPNGAGKTTLLRILSSLSRPTSGQVSVAGLDLKKWETEIRHRIGFASHQTLLYGDLSPVENLRFYGRMYGVAELEERIHELLTRIGLIERRKVAVRTLSRGMQQRLAIARAILHNPSIVFLDEPYTGLDQRAAEILTRLLRELLDEARTVLMATHNLRRGAEISDRVIVLLSGRIVYQTDTAALPRVNLDQVYHRYVEGRQ